MGSELILPTEGQLGRQRIMVVPSIVADAGEPASNQFIEFFTANIRKLLPMTRMRGVFIFILLLRPAPVSRVGSCRGQVPATDANIDHSLNTRFDPFKFLECRVPLAGGQ